MKCNVKLDVSVPLAEVAAGELFLVSDDGCTVYSRVMYDGLQVRPAGMVDTALLVVIASKAPGMKTGTLHPCPLLARVVPVAPTEVPTFAVAG